MSEIERPPVLRRIRRLLGGVTEEDDVRLDVAAADLELFLVGRPVKCPNKVGFELSNLPRRQSPDEPC